jgi:DNA polymerase (family X)
VRAYQNAARRIQALGAEDLGPMLRSGELEGVRGLGPATLKVVRDLIETGESRYLEQLRATMPEGLLELLDVPGLSRDKIHKLHSELGITSIADLESAASGGTLATIKGIGPKTAAKILEGIQQMRDATGVALYHNAEIEARGLLAAVRSHPDVVSAEVAGSLRRRREIVHDVDIVAACSADPERVAQSFTRIAGVRSATSSGEATVSIKFMSGMRLDLFCVAPENFAVALVRATGTVDHVTALGAHLAGRGLSLDGHGVRDRDGRALSFADEGAVYAAAGLAWIPPELREALGEVDAAASGALPALIEPGDIRGALHCHTLYSDGRASVADMAEAARERGWGYLGISDHSQAAFYAAGVSRERMLDQMDEIDALNRGSNGFRVLKGVEADILADGRLDYDAELLDRFDYVIASIHSRFKMDGDAMTARVLRAMDDPHMTILAHPTGRLLLSRKPYDIDLDAVFQKALERGVAIEINCDPHRMDLDWLHAKRARDLGVTIAIGPDAHSPRSLDWTDAGVAMARKAWLESGSVLNTRDADGVIEFARKRRT